MSTAITAIGIAVLSVLVAGYFAPYYLPPPKPKVVGIDLGTTYSCIGFYEPGTGKVRIIGDKNGRLTIPSIVSFYGDKLLVGREALSVIEENSHNTVYDSKRYIGRNILLEDLLNESKNYQFKLLYRDQKAYFAIKNETASVDGDQLTLYSPEYISSRILSALRESAESNLSMPVKMAVLAVPADFNELQRNATKAAAELAGLSVLRLISEPTAAALAYGLNRKKGVKNVVVVDIGGGTSDVSLLSVQNGMFLTQAIAGNNHLGGQDFNSRLFNHVKTDIKLKHGFDLVEPRQLQSLRNQVEAAKIDLARHHKVEMSMLIRPDVTYKTIIARDQFEQLNSDLFNKITALLDAVLRDVEMTPGDVEEVVLVGGSTRIPRIQQLIGDYFGRKPNIDIDPELAVVSGISIQAGILGGAWPLQVSAVEIPRKVRKIEIH